jgi:hypothetical protein
MPLIDAQFAVEQLSHNAVCLLVLFAVDHLVIKPCVSSRVKKVRDVALTRWFFVHSFANAFTVIFGLSSVIAIARDPTRALDATAHADKSFFASGSEWPLTVVNSVHVYHMIGGFGLSPADYFHHLLFIPTLGFPGQIYRWGALANFQAFFISGLPGGVDYFLLGLMKLGLFSKLREKRWNANLNTWCRAPGIILAAALMYIGVQKSHYVGHVPTWAILLQCGLPQYNALYYGKQAVANYSVHYMLDILGQNDLVNKSINERTSVTSGGKILDWKRALLEPQRGS